MTLLTGVSRVTNFKSNTRAIRAPLIAAAALVATLAAQPASAAIMLLTRTMHIYGANTPELHRALHDTDLVFKVKYDTERGQKNSVVNESGTTIELQSTAESSPVLEASYSFGGDTFDATGGGGAFDLLHFLFPLDHASQHIVSYSGAFAEGGGTRTFDADLGGLFHDAQGVIATDFATPFFAQVNDSGRFTFTHGDVNGILTLETAAPNIDGTIRVERLDVAAVPEPATWALMITGFGLAGAMLRRRRRLVMA